MKKAPKVVRLSDPYAEAADKLQPPSVAVDSSAPSDYQPLRVMGEIQEKGFASSSPSPPSLPRASVLPFPVARHRSEGPHWTPLAKEREQHDVADKEHDDDDDDGAANAAAAISARPLVPKRKSGLQLHKLPEKLQQQARREEKIKSVLREDKTREKPAAPPSPRAPTPEVSEPEVIKEASEASKVIEQVNQPRVTSKVAHQMSEAEAISEENRQKLSSMTEAEIAEALEKVHEDAKLVAIINKRIAAKHVKALAEAPSPAIEEKTSSPTIEAKIPSPTIEAKAPAPPTAREVEAPSPAIEAKAPSPAIEAKAASPTIDAKAPSPVIEAVDSFAPFSEPGQIPTWSDRVEAVKLLRFTLDGRLLHSGADDAGFQSVAERDILRSDGAPAAFGYRLKELVQLSRSTVAGQRALALQLIAVVLEKAADGLLLSASSEEDWQAIWAYALGPHPQLTLALRLALDDTHATVLVACARAVAAILSSSQNEAYFILCEASRMPGFYTAPVFRRRVKQDEGLIGGGRWKYNVKPSDLLPNESDGDATVSDQSAIGENDVAAGFLSMGILPRIRYLLEVEMIAAADEPLLVVLVSLVRHSPSSAMAVMECPRLMNTVIQRFLSIDGAREPQLQPARSKAIQLVRVLSQASKSNCLHFARLGVLQIATSDLFKWSFRFASGSGVSEGLQSTLTEAIRLWRVCIVHGLGLQLFEDVYPGLCTWLSPPSMDEISSKQVPEEAYRMAQESYAALEALATSLPPLLPSDEDTNAGLQLQGWSWSRAIPLVQTSLEWLQPATAKAVAEEDYSRAVAATLSFLNKVCERVCATSAERSWLPDFVPRVRAGLVRSGLLLLSEAPSSGRTAPDALGRATCLRAALRLARSLDVLLLSKATSDEARLLNKELLRAVAKSALAELSSSSLSSEAGEVNSSRGGPAPGLGVGWGAAGGGLWSAQRLLVRLYAALVVEMKEARHEDEEDEADCCMRVVAAALEPRLAKRCLSTLLLADHRWLRVMDGAARTLEALRSSSSSSWPKLEELLSVTMTTTLRDALERHLLATWLTPKRGKRAEQQQQQQQDEGSVLPAIQEEDEDGDDDEEAAEELLQEYRGMRLPLPGHWFLSPLHVVGTAEDAELVIRAGLLLLLHLETRLPTMTTAKMTVRKVHALSGVFLAGDVVFLEPSVSSVIGLLQDEYARRLDEEDKVDYEAVVDRSYSLFVRALAEHLSTSSLGDRCFGRQVAMYLRQNVVHHLRAALWRALENFQALHLLPTLDDCPGADASAYLQPAERDAEVLELYASNWVSGSLDRASARGSLPFRLALHHLAQFFFVDAAADAALRDTLARKIIRTSKRSSQSRQMLKQLLQYVPQSMPQRQWLDASLLNSVREFM